MGFQLWESRHAEQAPSEKNARRGLLVGWPVLALFVALPLVYFLVDFPVQPLLPLNFAAGGRGGVLPKVPRVERRCDVFKGRWVRDTNATYYSNATCPLIQDQQNCLKLGRPDRDFLNWRWKPDECELPRFDPVRFLELMRGKSLAFIGDSVARNHLRSLMCLLYGVLDIPDDVTPKFIPETRSRKWYFPEYNFTLARFWAPFLVKASNTDSLSKSYRADLRLDEPDESWAREIEKFDFVILSAGHWFFRSLTFYEEGRLVGCSACWRSDVPNLTRHYGYRKAFQTAYRTLLKLEGYKGVTILRTFSPEHFENGSWNNGGRCLRTRPYTEAEIKLNGSNLEMHTTQMEEFRAAGREAAKRGLKFRLLDMTEAMLLRPDGHPNLYWHSRHVNTTSSDCLHWCLPGPVDTWNELLLHVLISESV
ncbi:hypothetical protein MLD38_001249 [Melastoma candidum]|uniref:Uncharacterized protein n=1 Tax=Melastoma candidum TaxID=119954 RepID=A0ACB9SGK4_9MYRT|nr:hypothetical protein MLD38_001249 [Melastoma candidum]